MEFTYPFPRSRVRFREAQDGLNDGAGEILQRRESMCFTVWRRQPGVNSQASANLDVSLMVSPLMLEEGRARAGQIGKNSHNSLVPKNYLSPQDTLLSGWQDRRS